MVSRFALKDYSDAYEWPSDGLYVNHSLVPLLPFEKQFDFQSAHELVRTHFHSYIYFVLTMYIISIFGIKTKMQDHKPFNLRMPLIAWNFALAVFSTMGALRTVSELFAVYKHIGFTGTLCHKGHAFDVTGFWLYLFVLSKIAEFIDTIFIVLRKRPLIFLHWYHHVETAYYSIWSYTSPLFPVSRYFVALNYTVHSVMYTYYTAKACHFHVPKFVSVAVTTLQVSQMFVGLFVIISAINTDCYNHPPALYAGLLTYIIYALLFVHLFYKAYLRPTSTIIDRKKVTIIVNFLSIN